MNLPTQKVAIIGGGTSGLYLAWKLAEKGHRVVVFERKKEIGNQVCSGLFSQRILDFIPPSRKLIEGRKNFAFIHFPGKTIKLTFCESSKGFFVMSHYQLDRLLAYLAQEAGVKILLNHNISELPQGFDKIIGCDGANSFIRRKLELPDPNFRLGIQGFTQTKWTHGPVHGSRNCVETWPCEDGFVWEIPRGQEIEYGIIANPCLVDGIFRNFLERNDIKIERVKAKIIPQGMIFPDFPNITLCGDSTGLTKPWSGGGVIWQLTLADMLLKKFPDFIEYHEEAKRFFYWKIILSKIAIKIGYFLGFNIPWLLPKNIKIESDFLL